MEHGIEIDDPSSDVFDVPLGDAPCDDATTPAPVDVATPLFPCSDTATIDAESIADAADELAALRARLNPDDARPDLDRRKIEQFLAASGVEFDAKQVRPTLPCPLKACGGTATLDRDTDTVTCLECSCEFDVFDLVLHIHGVDDQVEARRIINRTIDAANRKSETEATTKDRPRSAKRAARRAEYQAQRENAVSELRERKRDPGSFPFTILGTGDDGRIVFLGRSERMHAFSPSSLTKSCLLALAPLEWWRSEFGYVGPNGEAKLSWDVAIDYIVQVGSHRDFSPDQVRGRGAWRERDGRICYHDGLKTIGDRDPSRLYVRRPRRDIGLEGEPATAATARKIEETIRALDSWKSPLDAVRVMGWATLAPFAGALPWRPAILITGESRSGKSTIIDNIIKCLADPVRISGGESSAAFVRQTIGIDACGVTIDEADGDTEKKKRIRDDLFSLMRMSTTEDAPLAGKGTLDGRGMRFAMHSSFLFAAIDPTIQFSADENRINRVELQLPDESKWPEHRARIAETMTDENGRGMRARTWKLFRLVLRTADRFESLIRDLTGQSLRFSKADGLQFAAYWVVLRGRDGEADPEVGDVEFSRWVLDLYNENPPEARRDENDEILDRLLDERVQVERPDRGTLTLREIVTAVATNRKPGDEQIEMSDETAAHLRGVAGRYGLGVTRAGELAVAHNHHEIMRILGMGRGYHRIVQRHEKVADPSRVLGIAGHSRRCVVLRDVLDGPIDSDTAPRQAAADARWEARA